MRLNVKEKKEKSGYEREVSGWIEETDPLQQDPLLAVLERPLKQH